MKASEILRNLRVFGKDGDEIYEVIRKEKGVAEAVSFSTKPDKSKIIRAIYTFPDSSILSVTRFQHPGDSPVFSYKVL